MTSIRWKTWHPPQALRSQINAHAYALRHERGLTFQEIADLMGYTRERASATVRRAELAKRRGRL